MLRSSRSVPTTQASGGGGWYTRWISVVRCNVPGEAPEVVEARKTWFVPGARSAIPGHEELGRVGLGLVRPWVMEVPWKFQGFGSWINPKIAGGYGK